MKQRASRKPKTSSRKRSTKSSRKSPPQGSRLCIEVAGTAALKKTLGRVLKIAAPPPDLSVSQWSDGNRRLSSEASAEPGQWVTERAEYQRGIMDTISDPVVEQVVVKTSAQVGKTECILNAVGYHIDQDPAPVLVVMPTERDAESWSKDRFATMARDTPCLRGKVGDPKSRDGSNKILHKKFHGGHLTIVGANAPSGLAMRPIRILLCDEVDRYPASAGTEGDPVNLAKKRTVTFWNSKIVLVSTPTIKGASRIDAAWEESDKRRYWVPCPDCGEQQVLKWEHVHWEKDENAEHLPETAYYGCEHCGSVWNDPKRHAAIRLGEWRAENPFAGTAGFHLNEIYSPWKKLRDMAGDFISAKRHGEEALKVFVNTSLGEVFEIRGEAPEWDVLYARREDYPIGEVPRGGLFLKAGADVHPDRIEVEVVAWGRNRESWSVDYRVLEGDINLPDVWNKLAALLDERFAHADGGSMVIEHLAIDTGYAAQLVYAWSRTMPVGRVMPVKGMSRKSPYPIVGPSRVDVTIRGRKRKAGAKLWQVNGDLFKAELHANLHKEPPGEGEEFPPGYCHFPKYEPEYFRQLTAEQAVTKVKKNGFAHIEWEKTRERNEALDCRVYARAAAEHELTGFSERKARNMEKRIAEVVQPETPVQEETKTRQSIYDRLPGPILSDDEWL
ncbi:MAG: phage terminase large subunit family protein [bacterium]|nr:phage terminase large subunit family protein [bacterium]